MSANDWSVMWHAAYAGLLGKIGPIVERARPALCGLSACVDATISLHDADALLSAKEPAEAVHLASTLLARAAAGIGGEIRFDWADGPRWLDRRLALRLDLGGTGAHAARALTVLGAPAVLALETRSPEQLSVLDPEIMIATNGRVQPARDLVPSRPNAVRIYVFEYTKGRLLGGIVPPRSSRIIVRFDDPGLENDDRFDQLSVRLAPQAGAAILSGFNGIGGGDLDGALARARQLSRRWLAAGLSTIHLELSSYELPAYRDRVLAALGNSITSLGLSLSEFEALVPGVALADGMVGLGTRLGLRRVCVHADGWAASATREDPEIERDALMMGCLLASARAAQGRPNVPTAIPHDAVFETPPPLPKAVGAWRLVVCAAPYLPQPGATVGLGDTFTAGCLLVLGQHRSKDPHPDPRLSRMPATASD